MWKHRRTSKLGILGGTFDPIHCGHLAIARAALERLGLDRIVFIPAGRPWLKTAAERRITDSAHRLAMVELAVVRIPDFTISTIDVDRPGPTYTIDTLVELLRQGVGDTELYLILGMDSVRELRRWRQPERIFDLATVVAVSRPLVDDLSADEIARTFPAARGRVIALRGPLMRTSATDIRDRVADGRPITGLAPEAVIGYIREHRLYRSDKM